MNINHNLFLLLFNVGLVKLILTVPIQNSLSETRCLRFGKREIVGKFGVTLIENNRKVQDGLPSKGLRNSQNSQKGLPEFGHNIEEWKNQDGTQPDNQGRGANPDPTLHKYKFKHKIHSHSHIHTHSYGDVSNGHFLTNPVITPVSSVIVPSGQQWHQSHNFLTGYNDKSFGASNHAYGVNNPEYGLHSQGNLQQNANLINNQKFQLNTHFINNQNSHLINQNSHLSNGNSNGGFRNDALNILIANLNGNNNALSQSTNKHINSHREINPILLEDDIRRTNLENENFQNYGEEFQDGKQTSFDLKLQDKPYSEDTKSAVYDSNMKNILNVLDMRSYLQIRPPVKLYPRYEKKYIDEENSEKIVKQPLEFTCTWYEPEGLQKLDYEVNRDAGRVQVNEEILGKSKKSDNMRLRSPYIIQIPYNVNFQSHRWAERRTKRSSENSNSKVLPSVATVTSNILNKYIDNLNSTSKVLLKKTDTSSKNSTSAFSYEGNNTNIHNGCISDHCSKNLNNTFREYRNMINNYRRGIKQKEEIIFADFLDGFVDDFQNKKMINSIKKVKKRAAPFIKLLHNPNVKLDVPKTLENIGTITRNAFEDKRAPMYHMRNLMGSTKNAVLSAMRIPPQNFIIPSNYQIENINPEEISDGDGEVLGSINRKMLSRSNFEKDSTNGDLEENNAIHSDPFGIVDTFTRVGSAIRDSVRSGQNTLSHIGDIAHNARKIYHTTKNTVPRVIIPYSKAPVVMRSRFKDDNKVPTLKKAVIITPRVVEVKEPVVGSEKSEPEYVKMGNILDALGISKPDKDELDLERFVIKTPGKENVRGIYIPPIGNVKSVNGKEIPTLKSAKNSLNRINEKVSSTSRAVKDVLVKMKNDAVNNLEKTKNQVKQVENNIATTLEYNKRKSKKLTDMFLKKTLGSNGGLESRIGNILDSRDRMRNFTKEEEKEIIDKFLDNIFKMDKKNDVYSKSVLYIEKKKQDKTNTKRLGFDDQNDLKHYKKIPKSLNLKSENEISFLPSQPAHGRTENEVNELMKNLTVGIPVDEKTKIICDTVKNKKNYKSPMISKKHKFKSEFVLRSRFGDDNEIDKQEATQRPSLNSEELGKNDDEAIRKVDEYVLNDIVSMKNDEGMQQLIEDPAEETSENQNPLTKAPEENAKPYSTRTLLRIPENESDYIWRKLNKIQALKEPRKIDKRSSDDQVVGLDLPPELLKPFMERASNKEVERIFKNDETAGEVVGSAQHEIVNNSDLDKNQLVHEKYDFKNLHYTPVSSISPSNVLEQMRSRANGVHYGTQWNLSDNLYPEKEDETYKYATNSMMEQPRYIKTRQQVDNGVLENSRREKESSEYFLCSSSSQDKNSPILCGNSYENSVYIPQSNERTSDQKEESGVGQSRTSMVLADNLKKPFMGLENKDAVKKFYEEYNGIGFMDRPNGSEENLFSDDYQ